MKEGEPRFCATVEFGSHVIKGCGATLEEAREDLIREIGRDPTLFEYEKVQLIRQIRLMQEQGGVV
jgi:hypothetical protein